MNSLCTQTGYVYSKTYKPNIPPLRKTACWTNLAIMGSGLGFRGGGQPASLYHRVISCRGIQHSQTLPTYKLNALKFCRFSISCELGNNFQFHNFSTYSYICSSQHVPLFGCHMIDCWWDFGLDQYFDNRLPSLDIVLNRTLRQGCF